jgi:hypothetical protein
MSDVTETSALSIALGNTTSFFFYLKTKNFLFISKLYALPQKYYEGKCNTRRSFYC